mmetsp:Transcript_40458/g.127371  ORF Transcript_40458/g.127371 Transcript_40458/m.127371 type:complete len:194 (+) Transcript_40458:606-1187(+)
MESPQTPMGGASMWSCQASPPTSGTRMCGIGCSINVNDWGELIIRKVVAGGPAAFSCEIACDDILLQVDGVSVVGETPEEVAKRIVGPEGMPITLMIRFRSFLEGRESRIMSYCHAWWTEACVLCSLGGEGGSLDSTADGPHARKTERGASWGGCGSRLGRAQAGGEETPARRSFGHEREAESRRLHPQDRRA